MIPLLIISNVNELINDYVDKLKKGSLFFEVTPITKEYSIDDIKSIAKETKVFYPQTRFYFFPDFHLSSIPAQNSFLKLLEEPPANVQFLLSTTNKNKLLPTIISRAKIVFLRNSKIIKIDQDLSNALIELTEQHDLKALNKNQFRLLKKDDALNLLNQIILFFRGRLEKDQNSITIIKQVFHLRGLMESNNLNPQLAVDQGLIFIWKKYRMK